jgi:hypothetical protein
MVLFLIILFLFYLLNFFLKDYNIYTKIMLNIELFIKFLYILVKNYYLYKEIKFRKFIIR